MTDEKIIELYWKRSEVAIQQTQSKYNSYCTVIAQRILGNREEVEEVVSDTYLQAWYAIPPQKPNPLKSFLGCITRRLSINRLEHDTAQKRGGSTYAVALEELQDCIPEGNAGHDMEDTLALQHALNSFLNSLSEQTRNIFIRRYWYLCTIEEIARGYGVGQSKVKMILLRTRNKLKDYLEQEGFDL